MKKKLSELPRRSGVGIVVLNKQNKVFVARRRDNPKNFWQMPQGGVDLGEDFLNGEHCVLILGDNLFYGETFSNGLQKAMSLDDGATIFGYRVNDPSRYGVVDFDKSGRVLSIEEKPVAPKSYYAVTGLYFYDGNASKYAHMIRPSGRHELEITSLNKIYLSKELLKVNILRGGVTWLDTGTHKSLFEAAQFVNVLQSRQGIRICCPEVIAYKNNWITKSDIMVQAKNLEKSGYGDYLLKACDS